MATSSFDKDFSLKSPKEVDSFVEILSSPCNGVKLNMNLVSPKRKRSAEKSVKRMLAFKKREQQEEE